MRIFMMGMLVAALAVLTITPAAPAKASVDDIKKQLQTAMFHAGELAQRGNAVAASKTHLQHVMNCLEGTGGPNFVASAGYPCQGMGGGILPDLRAAGDVKGAAEAIGFANAAWTLARTALRSNDIDEVQPYAKVVAAQLKLALDALQ